MKKKFLFLMLSIVVSITACTSSSTNSSKSYESEITELENLVTEIVSLQHQYIDTGDESIAVRGEEQCARLRELTTSMENHKDAFSIEQKNRINQILERLPQ